MNEPAEIALPAPATETIPTPLAALSLARNPAARLEAYGGSLLGGDFGDPSGELSALLHSVGLYDLGFRTRLAVNGEDRFRWLNGMVTNAVSTLGEGHGNYNFILNAQGRIQGDGYIFREGKRLLIDTDRSQAGRLFEHLDRFIIMDDVELSAESTTAMGLAGPGAEALLTAVGVAGAAELGPLQLMAVSLQGVPAMLVRAYSVLTPRFELWFEPQHAGTVWDLFTSAGAAAAGWRAQEGLRILEGTPVYGTDILERNLAQETSQTRALSFTKGCYIGQEIVERIRSRTTVHRFLRQLELTGPVPLPGAALTTPGEERAAGQLTSVASYDLPGFRGTLGLGYVRGEAIERRSALEYGAGGEQTGERRGTAKVLDAPPDLHRME